MSYSRFESDSNDDPVIPCVGNTDASDPSKPVEVCTSGVNWSAHLPSTGNQSAPILCTACDDTGVENWAEVRAYDLAVDAAISSAREGYPGRVVGNPPVEEPCPSCPRCAGCGELYRDLPGGFCFDPQCAAERYARQGFAGFTS